ncbi:2-oxo-4-hydroxy-4-carboxy-5-ureidoimidazoline decarboxylase-like [Manduca sexta]|uniref:2-oxo-4-hydroxy-4-carboxy-5-ureidoimidazoline decarboxylase-like n=1 Tax=Manduca sexta TaxID=7130 RepID=UPI00188FCB7A|nr:2-oxo-4-hydroxy-4-carboxy-5-ureidoimidazoline decarboxylase-like [Manduca sexta]
MAARIGIDDVNLLPDDEFVCVFGNVIELCPTAAIHVKKSRPFAKLSDIHDAFNKYLETVSFGDKLQILQLHPDLAGRLAAHGKLTKESTNEQRAAGLHELTLQQKSLIDKYNERYKTKFGFPFIVCARENKVESIIEGLQQRYCNTQEKEITIALEEVKKICKLRILDIVTDD